MTIRLTRCGALAALLASNALAEQPPFAPVPMSDEQRQVAATAFEDRAATRTYAHDTQAPTTTMTTNSGNELIGINGFDAVGGADILTSLSCIWANVSNGATARIFVWQADSTGDIRTAVPVHVQTVTIANANTGLYNRFEFSVPVRVTGRFFVGYSAVAIYGGTGGPLPLVPTSTPPSPLGRSWTGIGSPGIGAAEIVATAPLLDGLGFCYPVRVTGTSGAFSYQGRLADQGAGFSGVADMIFRVYDEQTGGEPRSPELSVPNVPVQGGVFSVEVPGDPAWFRNAPDLYLEIQVRRAGVEAFTTLSPRQRVTTTPAALFAVQASEADVAQSVAWSGITGVPSSVSGAFSPWSAATGGIAYTGGRVGIGTGVPAAPLHVSTGPVGGGWQLQLTNSAAPPTYETGMRMSDGGFFEITNRINGFTKVGRLDSTGAWTAASDVRLKTDLSPFGDALDAALRVRPVRFKWIGDGMTDFGVIAQELRSVLPEAVTGDESKDSLTVNYSKLSVVAIGAVQEQQAQIKFLKEQNDAKQREIEDLKARLERLERAVEQARPLSTRP
ncbi:MAG TPA: tail fiber domain-containing protein [Phycisphaerales bacterium]